jgi:hypothetical protein
MTFEEWWEQHYNSPVSMSSGMAEQAWNAAAAANMEGAEWYRKRAKAWKTVAKQYQEAFGSCFKESTSSFSNWITAIAEIEERDGQIELLREALAESSNSITMALNEARRPTDWIWEHEIQKRLKAARSRARVILFATRRADE